MKNIFTKLVIVYLFSLCANGAWAQVNCTTDLNVSLGPWNGGAVTLSVDMLTEGISNYDSIFIDPQVISCVEAGSTVNVSVVSYLNGIESECTVDVTVEDKVAPVVVVLAEYSVTLDTDGMASLTPSDLDQGTFDNCDDDLVLSLSQSVFDESYVGQVVPVYTNALDDFGNSNTAFTLVTVLPSDSTFLYCINNSTVVIDDFPIQLYPSDFVIAGGSGDYSINLTDQNDITVPNPIDPSYVGQTLNVYVTDNVFGTSCLSTLNVVGISTNCQTPSCINQLTTTLPGAGTGVALYASDFLIGDYSDCDTNLFEIQILDELGNTLDFGVGMISVFDEGSYTYVVTNPMNGNSCWGILLIQGDTGCDILACVGEINLELSTGNGVVEPVDCPIQGNLNGVGLIAEEIVASTGTNRCIKITVDNLADVQGAQSSLKWDPDVLKFTGTQNHNLPNLMNAFNTTASEAGEILFVWYDATGTTPAYLDDGEILFEICFDVIGQDGDFTLITFDNDEIIDSEFSNSNSQVLAEYFDCGSVTVGDGIPSAVIFVELLLEGEYNGCDLSSFEIDVFDQNNNSVSSGVGVVTLYENGTYVYSVTDPITENTCWGTIIIGDSIDNCENVIINDPALNIDLSFVGITEDNVIEKLSPGNLVQEFGVSNDDAFPSWDSSDCLIGYTYQDQVFLLADSDCSFKVVRLWTVVNWDVYDPNISPTDGMYTFTQIIRNIANCNYICDFLPNSTPFTDCAEGHSETDDVEWPDDLSISDYRITPDELVEFSSIDVEDSKPEYFNEPEEYTDSYIDILLELQPNYLVVNRLWSVERDNIEVASYGQKITVDISNLDSLVSVTTWTGRAVPNVELNASDFTNDDGVGYVGQAESLDPSKLDVTTNGINIKDVVMINRHLLGIEVLGYHQQLAADINNDANISGGDLNEVTEIVLGNSNSSSTFWKFLDETNQVVNPVGQPKAHYTALKPGDIDDSAVLDSEILPDPVSNLQFEDVVLNAGEFYEIPVFLEDIYNARGIELSLNYDASLINLTSIDSPTGLNMVQYNELDDYKIKALLMNSSTSEVALGGLDNDPVITISFIALSNTTLNEVLGMNPDEASYLLDGDLDLIRLGGDVLNVIPSGTKDVIYNQSVSVFPNPATDYISFKNDSSLNFENSQISFYNVMGLKIMESNFSERIFVGSLSSGMYIYRVELDQKIYTGNLMIAK